jgi:hypothetical protein
MNLRIFICMAVVLGALGINTKDLQAAAVLNSLLVDGLNTIQDTDYERLIKGVNPITGAPNIGTGLEVGDFLEAIVRFETINTLGVLDQIAATGGLYELTAYSRIQVAAITPTANPFLFDFSFTNGIDANTAVILYEDDANGGFTTFNGVVDPATGIARVTDGTLLATIGINVANGDFWEAYDAPTNISVFQNPAADPALQGGDFYFGLSLVTNPAGVNILTEANGGGVATNAGGNHAVSSIHDFVGNGSLKVPETAINAGWDAQTDTTFNFVATSVVPEPASMLVWAGIGLAGAVGGVIRRRRK